MATTNGAHSIPDRSREPVILAVVTNALGHIMPILQITQHLAEKNYDILLMTGPDKKALVENAGVKFFPSVGEVALPVELMMQKLLRRHTAGTVGNGNGLLYGTSWAYSIPSWVESIRLALSHIRLHNPEREVILMLDSWVSGILPLKLGASLPPGYSELPKTLGLSVIPPLWTSVNHGSLVGNPLPFNPDPINQPRNIAFMMALSEGFFKPLYETTEFILQACGAQEHHTSLLGEHAKLIPHIPWDASYASHNTILQMCIPSLEYPVCDFPPNMKFGGTLPPKHNLNKNFKLPEWMSLVQANSANHPDPKPERKRIVAVAQGTLAVDFEDLIIPTIQGLAHRDDLIVVAILGVKSATLPAKMTVPRNTTVVDYFPYDVVLEHADLFVANGSYGVFSHCVAHGVPMVLSGETEDKADMGARGEYVGFAVNLRVQRPTPETLHKAVEEVLVDGKYKKRAMELRKEAEEFNCLETVERELRALF